MQDWEVEQALYEASSETGWDDASRVAVLSRLIGEFTRAGKIKDTEVIESLKAMAQEELAMTEGVEPEERMLPGMNY